jgi:hypothetical protein
MEGVLFISAAVAKNGPWPRPTNMHRIAQWSVTVIDASGELKSSYIGDRDSLINPGQKLN